MGPGKAHGKRDLAPATGVLEPAALSGSIGMTIIPSQIWDSLLVELRRGFRRVERVAFLDGIETAGHQAVTTLTIPNAKLSPHCYSISPEAMAEAGRHLFEWGLVRI